MKKFPRKPRNQKGSPEDGKETAPISPTKAPKKTPTSAGKSKRQKKHKKEAVSVPNGSSCEQLDEDAAEPSGELDSTVAERDEDLALSDTDLANVKFKISPSEAMLYLQSTSTSVSQLFKYDSLDSLHERASLASPLTSSVENTWADGSNGGHPYLRVTAHQSPGVPASSSLEGSEVASTNQPVPSSSSSHVHGVNGCDHCSRDPSYRGKRGPEEAARAAAREVRQGRGVPSDEELSDSIGGGAGSAHSQKRMRTDGDVPLLSSGAPGPINRHHMHSRPRQQSGSVSTPPLTPNSSPAPPTILSPGSQPSCSSRMTSPDPQHLAVQAANMPPLMAPPSGHNNSTLASYSSPYVTPQSTPVHTPYHSPQPSPHTPSLHQQHFQSLPASHHTSMGMPHLSSAPSPASWAGVVEGVNFDRSSTNGSAQATSPPSALSSLNLPGLSPGSSGVIQLHQQHNTGECMCVCVCVVR